MNFAETLAPSDFGITLRRDGIQLSGPGAVWLQSTLDLPRERATELAAIDQWSIRFQFGVAGIDRRAELNFDVGHRTQTKEPSPDGRATVPTYTWKM
jgi:hypothetical protein